MPNVAFSADATDELFATISDLLWPRVMPKKVEQQLKRQAAKKGLTGRRADAYVYGTLRKITGWRPGQK